MRRDVVEKLFEHSPVGFAILNRDGTFYDINKSLAATNGFPAEFHRGKHIKEILGSCADDLETILQRVWSSRGPIRWEFHAQLRTRSTVSYWVAEYFLLKEESGLCSKIGALVLDVTAERLKENTILD